MTTQRRSSDISFPFPMYAARHGQSQVEVGSIVVWSWLWSRSCACACMATSLTHHCCSAAESFQARREDVSCVQVHDGQGQASERCVCARSLASHDSRAPLTRSNPPPPHPRAAGPSSHLNMFDAAARARQENLLKAKGWKLPPPEQSTKSGAEVIHIDSSSGDEWIAEHLRSEKARKSAAPSTQGAAQSQASLPIAPDTSILPPSDPPTSPLPPPPPKRPSEQPLSTPAVVRKNKRSRAFEDDDDNVRLSNRFLGFFSTGIHNTFSPS